jgi:hypothetical protein
MMTHIRPSALPKLEQQPCFVGKSGEASDAAQRGTKLDLAWRTQIATGIVDDTLSPEDQAAVSWAVDKAHEVCGGAEIFTDEGRTTFVHSSFVNKFTADGVCHEKKIILDLKTGQLRSYKAQLAAYCLALMEDDWTSEAEGVAIFCDQREAIHYKFTLDEAHSYVDSIIDAVVNRPSDVFYPGEYCGWCANGDACPARVKDAEQALQVITSDVSLSEIRERILATPEALGEFWRQYKLFEKEIVKPVAEKLRERLDAGEQVPGWRIRYDAPREYFDSEAIEEIAYEITTPELITLLGAKVSGKAFREFCAVKGLPINEAQVRTGAPIAKIMPVKTKR